MVSQIRRVQYSQSGLAMLCTAYVTTAIGGHVDEG